MPEFVVDLPCTSRVWEVEYPEFVIATLESLSAKFDEKLGQDAAQGLTRAAGEKMTSELWCASRRRLGA